MSWIGHRYPVPWFDVTDRGAVESYLARTLTDDEWRKLAPRLAAAQAKHPRPDNTPSAVT